MSGTDEATRCLTELHVERRWQITLVDGLATSCVSRGGVSQALHGGTAHTHSPGPREGNSEPHLISGGRPRTRTLCGGGGAVAFPQLRSGYISTQHSHFITQVTYDQ